jgi:hypothetical protein
MYFLLHALHLYSFSVSIKFCRKWEEIIGLSMRGRGRQGAPGSKPRSGWTRDIGFKVEQFAADNELANFHPQTNRLQLPGVRNSLRLPCGIPLRGPAEGGIPQGLPRGMNYPIPLG